MVCLYNRSVSLWNSLYAIQQSDTLSQGPDITEHRTNGCTRSKLPLTGNIQPKSLFKDVLHSLGTNLVLIPLSVLLSILLARFLGPEGKGGYDLFVATGGLLMMILGFSLPSGITYVTAFSIPSVRAMSRWLILAGLIQGVLVVPLLIIAKRLGFISTFLPSIGGEGIILLSAGYVLLTTLTGYWKAILIGRQQIIVANHIVLLTRLVEVVLFVSALAILSLLGRPFGLSMVIGMLLVSSFVSNMFFLHKLCPMMAFSSQDSSGVPRS